MKGKQGKASKSQRRNSRRSNDFEAQSAAHNDFEAHVEREMNKIRFGKLEARGQTQGQMISQMNTKRIVFVNGPAGTGKTFVATSYAAELLEAGAIERIVIARPMVGCDEEMGFLPGDEYEKYQPWLEPFLDVLEGKLGPKKVATYLKFGKIVARPLMMMRGVTFRNAFVILDEAQNTTTGQMKMFLTRIGEGTRVVVNGDPDQHDLNGESGLVDALRRFDKSKQFGRVEFTDEDITRDPVVREVLMAYRK